MPIVAKASSSSGAGLPTSDIDVLGKHAHNLVTASPPETENEQLLPLEWSNCGRYEQLRLLKPSQDPADEAQAAPPGPIDPSKHAKN